MSDALCIDNLWWRYPTYSDEANPWVLRDVSLQVERGACFGITGPGGAGKTTLCRSMLGIIPHNARLTAEQLPHHFRGSVSIYGEPVTAAAPVTSHIGMVLQDPENQFLRMSLLHELALGLQISGLSNDEILARTHEALTMVGLEHLWYGAAYIHPADLSGGQKQRVAIAAFLAMRPRVLVLDEPTSDLDPAGKREIIKTIARLRDQEGMTIILVEQDPDILATFCDTIALLHEGRVELVAPPADFYAHRELIERTGTAVGELPRISWHSGYTFEGRPPLTIEEGVVAFGEGMMEEWMITDGEADAHKGRPSGSGEMGEAAPCGRPFDNKSEAIITAENVCYQYADGTEALEGIDLSIYRGEMLALLGPNGSGKTTLAKILAGIYPASRGRVEVLGQDLARRRVRAGLARSVGYVFQNPDHQLFRRKVRDEISYGLKNLGIDGVRRGTIIEETLEAVQLARYADEDPLFLSKGQRQRLAVAAVLAMGPEILIVDEPTTGQDFRSVQAIMRLLLNLQQQGKTILIITHDMSLVAEYCQRAVAFRDGSIVFTGAPRELFSDADALHRTGLRQPTAAALSTRLREQQPGLPFLMTVQEWTKALLSLEKRR